MIFETGTIPLVWPNKLTAGYFRAFHTREVMRLTIDGTLLLFGIGSFILFAAVHFPHIATGAQSPLFLVTSTHGTAQMFWISLLCDAWLAARIHRAGAHHHRVLSRAEEETLMQKKVRRPIDLSKTFDTSAINALSEALSLAQRRGALELVPFHLFVVLFHRPLIQALAGRIALDPTKLKRGIRAALDTVAKGRIAPTPTADFYSLLVRAYHHAQEAHKETVDVVDLFAATLDHETRAQELMEELNVRLETIENVISWFNADKTFRRVRADIASVASLRPREDIDRAMTGRATHMLNRYGEDLTRLAQYGRLVFPVAVDVLLDQLLSTIAATSKNILLVGPTGTGKSTLINGVAYAMAGERVPGRLKDKRLMRISAGHIGSSQNPPAVFQELLDETLESGNVVLAITNLHDFTPQSGISGFDLAEMLAETIEHTGLMVVATTTPGEYHRFLEQHPIASLFNRVDVVEPDENTAIRIAESHVPGFETRFPVFFTYDAIAAAVRLSNRYIHDIGNPQKAIDLLEQTALAIGKQKKRERIRIAPEDIARVLEGRTHAKVGGVGDKERSVLLNLEDTIHERMVNQEQAVGAVANALRRARVELRETKRPVGVFLFLGPTGVGKTELAKTLAEVYFGSEENMVRIDMSEYQDYAAIPRLIGVTGSDVRGGILTEALRAQPFTLLLLDELEKASTDVRNLFLQVFEDGRVTDNTGAIIDFTNTIIIATSNAGSQFIQDAIRAKTPSEEIKTRLLEEELRNYYTPEFLNRFDDIIIFQPLSQDHIRHIARLMVSRIQKQMQAKGIIFMVTDAAIAELAAAGFDPEFGARPLRRTIQQRVDDVLAKILLEQKVSRRDTIILDTGNSFRIEKAKKFTDSTA